MSKPRSQTNDRPNANDEYESLVYGQSIWSTDLPKESKKQFISNLKQFNFGNDASPPPTVIEEDEKQDKTSENYRLAKSKTQDENARLASNRTKGSTGSRH